MSTRVLAFTGGIGGAKLALGLQRVVPPEDLTIVANTGDDFVHLGLAISPDVDTLLYTLGGVANPSTGWGRAEESWHFMTELARLGGETWFRLGDKDLAIHVERTRRLARGEKLSGIVSAFASRFGIRCTVLPMSDDLVRTILHTDVGRLTFQDYFVARQCAPVVQRIEYAESALARASVAAEDLRAGRFDAVVICPSNPYLSIDPIFAIPAWHEALVSARVPVIAVSPVIAGAAVKGPTAKIMRELGIDISARSIARHYSSYLDGFVLDDADAGLASQIDIPVCLARTLMKSDSDKEALARRVLEFARAIR